MAGTRGGFGRLAAMVVALALAMLLALAGRARGEELRPLELTTLGGDGWRSANDFSVSWRNPAGAEVAGASWRLASPSLITGAQFVPGAGLTEIDHIHVPAAGTWTLVVWLREAGGWEYEPFNQATVLRLDDVAPAVSFLSGDAEQLPPQLVAAVADPLTGVADGTISFRRLDQERWTELPTQIRAGALGTELVAATPELKPGTSYLFGAEARDGAGNVGTTTMRADGAPMQFRAPQAAAGADGGSGSGGSKGGGSRGAGPGTGERPRLLVGLAGGRQGADQRGCTTLTVGSGEAVVLRGLLAAGLAGLPLRVVIRPARGARGGIRVESLTTAAGGRFELRLPPGPSRRLTVSFPGAAGLRPARRRLELRVRAALSLRASSRRLRTGARLRLQGRVATRGARVPRTGKLVTISYWEREAHRWRPVIVTHTDRAGRFRAAYRFRYVTGRARIRLRAEAPAEAQWPYAPGASRPLTVEVRG